MTLSRRHEEHPSRTTGEPTLAAGRPSIGSALRSRFGFSLIQAPLLKSSAPWIEEFESPERRTEVTPEPMPARSQPLEEGLELSMPLRGHRVAPRA